MNESYTDRWMRHADEPLAVYVPSEPGLCARIAPRSGIVGRPASDRIEICYEGNLHGAVNLDTWEKRVESAAGRLITGYPTVARAFAFQADLTQIGTFVPRTGTFNITNRDALKAWLGEQENE